MQRKYATLLAVLLAASAVLSGCGGSGSSTAAVAAQSEVSLRETVEEADPQGAVDAILATLEDRDILFLDEDGLEEIFGISAEDTQDFVAVYSNANSGLCDLAFIDPVDDLRDQIREQLYAYRDKRANEFANYDVLGSQEISAGAEVLDQGDYLVLLMLPDNEAAKELIDNYIPQ